MILQILQNQLEKNLQLDQGSFLWKSFTNKLAYRLELVWKASFAKPLRMSLNTDWSKFEDIPLTKEVWSQIDAGLKPFPLQMP